MQRFSFVVRRIYVAAWKMQAEFNKTIACVERYL